MTVYALNDDPYLFPPPDHAEPDGLLALGGDLTSERLVAAYSHGLFPWYNEDTPILWWTPDPRLILVPWEVHVPRRLARFIRHHPFSITHNTAFEQVIHACAATPRPAERGTWLVPEMIEAYIRLHEEGFAISTETWLDGELVGGIYGVALGKAFFGESMFHTRSEASKLALLAMVRLLDNEGFHFIDCQQTTPHMLRFGAREVPRTRFYRMLALALAG